MEQVRQSGSYPKLDVLPNICDIFITVSKPERRELPLEEPTGERLTQAYLWARRNGPLLVAPALAPWLLHQLVRSGYLIKLRKDLYGVPNQRGQLQISPYTLPNLLAPESYVSFHSALAYWGLAADKTHRVVAVGDRRRASVAFPPWRIDFLVRAPTAKKARVKLVKIDNFKVRMATPEQAFLDLLSAPELCAQPAWAVRVLKYGVRTGQLDLDLLRKMALEDGSLALARRLGLLFELAFEQIDPLLLAQVRRSHTYLLFSGRGRDEREAVTVVRWMLKLPSSPELATALARTKQ